MSEQGKRPRRRGPGPMGGGRGMQGGEKPKSFKKTMKKLLFFLSPYRFKFGAVILFSILSCIFSIIGPMWVGRSVTIVSEGASALLNNTGGMDFGALGTALATLGALYVTSFLFSFLQNFIVSGMAANISKQFRRDISTKINRLPLKYFDKVSHGEVLSRVTNDVDTINQSLNQSMAQILSGITTVIGVFIMMLLISPVMTLIAITVIPLTLFFVSRVVKFSQKYFKDQQEYLGHVNGQVEEIYSGQMIVKAFSAEERVVETFNEFNDVLYKSAWKSQFISGFMQPIVALIGNLSYVAVCIVGSFMTISGRIEVGSIISFIQYMRNFTQPLSQMAQVSNVLQSTAAAAERVFDFLEQEEEPDESGKPAPPETIQGSVRFENVTFGYVPDSTVINNFSADIKPGQKIAIVGHTGAGKTTIVKLLMRFYEINSGHIYVDGHDIQAFNRRDLRDVFGMVLQDTWLFGGTVRENIRYGKLDATDQEVYNAAKAANVDRFIRTLPGGYDFEINEESGNVSQGQKQLLTIARAFLSDPKILILDEATSSVDTRTEVMIQKAMNTLMKGRTSFVIAHRLSTIRDADLILVMDNGRLVEQGAHEELLEKGGHYAELYNSQFEQTA